MGRDGSSRISIGAGLDFFDDARFGRRRAVSIRFADLTRREADLALRTQRPQSGDLVSVKLGQRRWLPMIARSAAGKHKPATDFGQLDWVGWGDDMQSFPPARWLAKYVPRSAVVLSTSHISAQVSAVQAGVGAALLPPVYARLQRLAPVRFARALAPLIDELPSSDTWLVGHRALREVPRVAAVWTFLLEEFERFEAQ